MTWLSGPAFLDDDGQIPPENLPPITGTQLPVGSIHLSISSTNPAVSLGYGTWAAFGAGRMLVGVDPGDPDFDTPEETGGSKVATPAGTVAAPVFTGSSATSSATSAGTPSGS